MSAVDKTNGSMGARAAMVAATSALGLLGRIADTLDRVLEGMDEETDFDTTYVVGGTFAAAAVMPIQLPRTIHHAQIELSVGTSDATKFAALFAGSISLGDAANSHNPAAGGSSSGAIAASNGNKVEVRDSIGQTGILTVYFTGAGTIYANVRVRSLDNTQSRARRT